MWYIVVVFFASGSVTGPAHFEDGWYPKPLGINSNIEMCRRIGNSVLNFLRYSSTTTNGEAFEVACISASGVEELSDIINGKWTFEPAPLPAPPPVLDTPA